MDDPRRMKIDAEKLTADAAVLAENDFLFFCWYFLRDHFNEKWGDVHKTVAGTLEDLQRGRHTLLLLPRGHGKSTLLFGFILWNLCYRRRKYIFLLSATFDQAASQLGRIRNELAQNNLLRAYFGDLVGNVEKGNKAQYNSLRRLRTSNQCMVKAMGMQGSARGANESLPDDLVSGYIGRDRHGQPVYNNATSTRPDLLVLDDIIEDKHVQNIEMRNKVYDWFWKTLMNLPDADGGNVVIVGTTLHKDDLVSRLWKDQEQTSAWQKYRLPACDGFDTRQRPVNCLWPEKWGKAVVSRPVDSRGRMLDLKDVQAGITPADGVYYLSALAWKAKDLGSLPFAQEYLLNPVDDAVRFFDKRKFGRWVWPTTAIFEKDAKLFQSLGVFYEEIPHDLYVVTSLDPAASRGKNAEELDRDYTAVVTQGWSPSTGRYYMLRCDRVRVSPPEVMHLAMSHYVEFSKANHMKYGSRWVPTHLGIIVESVAYQKAIADMLDEMSIALKHYALVIEVKRSGKDKRARAMKVSGLVERGEWSIPLVEHADMADQSVISAMEEMDDFPQGAHDDTVDSIVDSLSFLQEFSRFSQRGIPAMVALSEIISNNPSLYAFSASRDGQPPHKIIASYEELRRNKHTPI